MKNYYIISHRTPKLTFKDIRIAESFDKALDVIKNTKDYTGKEGNGKITLINENFEELFSWYYIDNILVTKFDHLENKKVM